MKVPREAGGSWRKVPEVMTEGAFINGALIGISENRQVGTRLNSGAWVHSITGLRRLA